MTPPGIEPATFRLVTQCLSQLRNRVPLLLQYIEWNQGVFSCTFLCEISRAYPVMISPRRTVGPWRRRATWPDYATGFWNVGVRYLQKRQTRCNNSHCSSCSQAIEKHTIGLFCENIVDISVYAILCGYMAVTDSYQALIWRQSFNHFLSRGLPCVWAALIR